MGLAGGIAINIYSLALLAVIYYHSLKQDERGSVQHKLYMTVLRITVLMLVFDTFGRFDGRPGTIYPFLNHGGNLLLFMFSPVLPSAWLVYAHLQVFGDMNKARRLLVPLIAINAGNAIMSLLTTRFGWYFSIDAANIYHRGPLFWVPASITIGLVSAAFVMIVVNRKRVDRKHFFPLVFFAVPPAICIGLQIVFYGTSLMLNAVVLSLLIVFLNVQNHSLYTDYLTGVSNRKRLEAYLEEKISGSTHDRTFSAILVDLDNFKSINDTFGHDMGDRALQISAELLKNCLRSDDFVARFGGDEFCIVLDISDEAALAEIVRRIDAHLEKYNSSSDQPYALGFSMGYAVYDFQAHLKVDEYQKLLDTLMYEDKKRSGPRIS